LRAKEIGRSDKLKNYVSASVLSADMLDLGSEIRKLERSGIDMLHFDVMDGVFVNNITFGLPILEQVRKTSDITLDVHLMIQDPAKYIKRFAEAGADMISFHAESDSNATETLRLIRECGVRPAIAIKPATPAEAVFELLPNLDMVLVMTVEPGFGGQSFIPETVDKIRTIRSKITELGLDVNVEVDGGINDRTAAIVRNAGANVLVSGSYLFHAAYMAAAANALKEDRIC
jgi:ribulose-phosphate 3-epimerase